jgi:hypothetical protein
VTLPEQDQHRLDRIARAASRPVAERGRIQIRLEDRLQYQFRGGLHHAVPYRRHTPSELHYIPIDLWVRLKSFTHSTRGAASGLSF